MVTLSRGSGARKSTGSFYTPQPIANYLVRRVLGPLVQQATPERILQLRVLDPAMGSGAFLVAACTFLTDAYEAALIRQGGCRPDDFGERERALARRLVAERCLYGVDVNPTAVQLGRLSLWLATLAADRPLTFLDHHLQAGDSLLGAWLASLRAAPELRRARTAAQGVAVLPFADSVNDALRTALPVRYSLETGPNDSADEVRAKERALAALSRRDTLLSKWKRIANLWCAPWFADRERVVPTAAFGALSDAILGGSGALPTQTSDRYLQSAEAIAKSRRLFHWELEFPEVFFDVDGTRLPNAGFDAVIGNPPWDMVRADWGSADDRHRSRDDAGRVLRFTRDAGVYTAQSPGHANRYQLFLERSVALVKHGGRLGLVLPAGLATDHGSASLRRRLLADCAVDALVGFDNQRGIFPIHRGLRFMLLTASRGSPTRSIACRFGERDPTSLEEVGEEPAGQCAWFPVSLAPELLRRVSGDDLAIPEIRTPIDLAIVERAAALFPMLGSPDGWNVRFGRELNASDDRSHFRPPGAEIVVVEGKQIEPFRVNLDSARYSLPRRVAARLLDSERFARSRLAYRDVASSTNRLTLIAAVLPAGCVSTHTLWCLRSPLPGRGQDFLCGLFNSLVLNYLVRLRVTTHVTTGIVESLPVASEHHAPGALREISALSRILSRRFDLGLWARLQAIVAGLYQLGAVELDHVLSTFPLIPANERAAVRELFASQIRSR
jgi:Eco57I restriction-modification methylase